MRRPRRYGTGGLAVTPAPYRMIDAAGRTQPDLYALGIPTEHTRWFTQVGSSRPGGSTLFCRDAEAIACELVRAPAEAPQSGRHGSTAATPTPALFGI